MQYAKKLGALSSQSLTMNSCMTQVVGSTLMVYLKEPDHKYKGGMTYQMVPIM